MQTSKNIFDKGYFGLNIFFQIKSINFSLDLMLLTKNSVPFEGL